MKVLSLINRPIGLRQVRLRRLPMLPQFSTAKPFLIASRTCNLSASETRGTSAIWSGRCRSPNSTRPRRCTGTLAAAALQAAAVAARVELPDAAHFTAKRRAIRQALVADGVAEAIERLVDALLPP
jgi:hypothetical protein